MLFFFVFFLYFDECIVLSTLLKLCCILGHLSKSESLSDVLSGFDIYLLWQSVCLLFRSNIGQLNNCFNDMTGHYYKENRYKT